MNQRSDAVVLFGATGDLARKKLFPALYELAARGALDVPVIGVARSEWDDERLRGYAEQAIRAKGAVDDGALAGLLGRLSYVSGDYGDQATHRLLVDRLAGARAPLIYLAIPPSVFPSVVAGLREAGLAGYSRVLVEKPFGRDLASAQGCPAPRRSSPPASRSTRGAGPGCRSTCAPASACPVRRRRPSWS